MSVPYNGGYTPQPQVDFGWISRGWNHFKLDIGAWVGATVLLVLIVSLLTVPIASVTGYSQMVEAMYHRGLAGRGMLPPGGRLQEAEMAILMSALDGAVYYIFLGGILRMAIRSLRSEQVSAVTFLSVGDVIVPLIVAGAITGACVGVGNQLCYLPGLVLQALFMFVPALIVDRKLGPLDAISESFRMLKNQWLMAVLLNLVFGAMILLGLLVCCVGFFVAYPVWMLSVAVGYLAMTQPLQPAAEFGQASQGVWPPPPGSNFPGSNPPPPGPDLPGSSMPPGNWG